MARDLTDAAVGVLNERSADGGYRNPAWHRCSRPPTRGAARTSRPIGLSRESIGAMSGMYWVMLLGLIGATPLFSLTVGAAFGTLEGAFRDYGIDDDWDLRSLLLNFEFNVECYEETLAQALNSVI